VGILACFPLLRSRGTDASVEAFVEQKFFASKSLSQNREFMEGSQAGHLTGMMQR
jgi:hypothetical protein